MCTLAMVLVVCGCRSTVLSGVTVPLACSSTGTSWRFGATTLTVVGPCGPFDLAAAVSAPPWLTYQTPPPMTTIAPARNAKEVFFIFELGFTVENIATTHEAAYCRIVYAAKTAPGLAPGAFFATLVGHARLAEK